ncbi:VOC family protein [Phototrophicus methaneseepsis]|uniref:VOC family protein n=1 Tax=Phototrophicus methaneseepsis TaxID=2710758 RepID=A0A7S8IFL0_9CHLR|nr:VOC family protein [Phototrophicus methaneseepsis]QPC83712.1 VOC family protein [Phototrophicus methaneseepsis]
MIIQRTNTILYCTQWEETVSFYRDTLGFAVSHQTDWFVEFQLTLTSYLSIADTAKATIESAKGQGITLSWQVQDVVAAHTDLQQKGVRVTDIKQKWRARLFYFYDPERHRIELWQPLVDEV